MGSGVMAANIALLARLDIARRGLGVSLSDWITTDQIDLVALEH